MKKKLFAAVCTCFLVVSMVVPVVAIEPTASDVETITPKGALIISDPETGEQWNWDLQAEDISVKRNSRAADGNSIKEAAVNVDVGEYLRRTMTIPVDGEETIRYEVPITVGLRYSVDEKKNAVSIYRAFGSAPETGMYYAINKVFYLSNYFVFGTMKQYPTTDSWSYTTDSTPGTYNGTFCPHALLDCRITVRGMESSYRDVSVIFELDFV